jgi:hypothetical protein
LPFHSINAHLTVCTFNRLRIGESLSTGPADIIDAMGGWSTEGVGQRYGVGFDLKLKLKWMKRLTYH